MLQHERPGCRVERISQDADEEDDNEKGDVEDEEDGTENVEERLNCRIERGEGVEQNPDYPCSHCHGKLMWSVG